MSRDRQIRTKGGGAGVFGGGVRLPAEARWFTFHGTPTATTLRLRWSDQVSPTLYILPNTGGSTPIPAPDPGSYLEFTGAEVWILWTD